MGDLNALPNPTLSPIANGDPVNNPTATNPHDELLQNDETLRVVVNTKSDKGHGHAISDITSLQSTLNAKAPLDSPTFSGAPTVPTPASASRDTTIPSTRWVRQQIYGGSVSAVATWAVQPYGSGASWSVAKLGTGKYRVTHNMSTLSYVVNATAHSIASNHVSASIYVKALNYFDVYIHFGQENAAFQYVDDAFDFLMLRA